ncbi:MAG: Gfo/Idh/MocA family oxidoreductase [Treponema sp.]|jgi:predicted dehydrogenase|nr:Gfo/Idh/MocA family oxidoreductase [Treponema sp.]
MIESSTEVVASVKLRYGMVGGGPGAFIGDVHRKAINLDGMAEIAAGCFSQDPQKTLAVGAALGIPKERLYGSFEEMAEQEAKRPDKIDFLVITTPNTSHFAIAKAFLSRGIPVVCEKPLATELADAEELAALVKKTGLPFMITYNYTGNVTIKHARELIRSGELGKITFVNGEYPQEWLMVEAEKQGSKQAVTRTDPKLAGHSNSVGDLGSHIESMVSYLTGLRITSVCARLDRIFPGRTLDDNATIMLEYDNGAKGVYWTSQIAAGYDNALRVRIFGTKGAIDWNEESSNYLGVAFYGKPKTALSRGRDPFFPHAQGYSRIPSGHPEGYHESLANLYKTFISALIKRKEGKTVSDAEKDWPTVDMGVDGVKFISKCVESSEKGALWVQF